MRTEALKNVWTVLFLIIYNAFFWSEQLGLNLLLFSGLLSSTLFWFYRENFRSINVRISLLFTLFSAVCVVYHGSLNAKIAHIVSYFVFLGFCHTNKLRLVSSALAAGLLGQVFFFRSFSEQVRHLPLPTGLNKKHRKFIKISVIPLVFFSIFFILFKLANPVFNDLTNNLGNYIGDWFSRIFEDFSLAKILFLVLGLAIILATLVRRQKENRMLAAKEEGKSDLLRRQRKRVSPFMKMTDLKTEYLTGLILVVMVNTLLLAVNFIDIRYLWFAADYSAGENLAAELHEGTYMLIISILLSMGILMYFFRRNINFYTKNGRLKTFAYVWIAQNAILVISVAVRCGRYISEHGLAYKRIGVLLFLSLTLYGLYSLFIKIQKQKSGFFLWRTNLWAAYSMLIFVAVVNWDLLIVEHNIQKYIAENKQKIDIKFLLSRSDKTLALIVENKGDLQKMLDKKAPVHKGYSWPVDVYSSILKSRIENYLDEQKEYSWLSWNYADSRALNFLKEQAKTD